MVRGCWLGNKATSPSEGSSKGFCSLNNGWGYQIQVSNGLCPIPGSYLRPRLERVMPLLELFTGMDMAGVPVVPLAVPCHPKHTSGAVLHLSTHSLHLN